MYTAFYGLREKPFALSPDPRFLYLAASHREALAHLLYGIEQGEGFIAVTGEVGTGKTTLCRTLLERLEGETEIAFLFNPARTALELLQSISSELELPAEGLARRALMAQLDRHLLEQKRRGRRVLLIIDEAQTLSEGTLEQVRLLSNLETSREKLIQILLLGQPELDRKLDAPGLRQLRQRISVRWKLGPLGAHETRAYVRHRLAVAAGQPTTLFSDGALREVYRRTGGIPRLVNQLCDRALLAGYAARSAEIGPRLVRAAAQEIPDTRRAHARSAARPPIPVLRRPWLYLAGSLGLVGLGLFAGLQLGRDGLTSVLGRAPVAMTQLAGTIGDALPSTETVEASLPDVGSPPPLARLIGPVVADSDASPGGSSAGTGAEGAVARGSAPGPGSAEATAAGGGGMTRAELARLLERDGDAAADPRLAAVAGRDGDWRSGTRAEATALSPGLLARMLPGRDAGRALVESQRAVLERFGRSLPPSARPASDPDALRGGFTQQGLQATTFDGGSLALLRELDHPVLLPLASQRRAGRGAPDSPTRSGVDEATPRWVALVGFEPSRRGDGRAVIAGLLPGRLATVPVRDLEAHWLETGVLVWESFEPTVPSLVALGDEGQGVVWLQRALAELSLYEGPTAGTFDRPTLEALETFQRRTGLVVDGLAGPLTQIALYARLPRYPVPRLSAGVGSAGSPSESAAGPARPPDARAASGSGSGEEPA